MELILINERKLKVILSSSDMAHYGIACDELDYSSTETKRVFWEILDAAKHKTGFDGAGARLSVRVFSSRDGGCEMFVTKYRDENEYDAHNSDENKNDSLYTAVATYALESVISLCIRLDKASHITESELFLSENGEYFLLIGKERMPSYIQKYECGAFPEFLGEYGRKIPVGRAEHAYICEHMKRLAGPDAVGLFAEKFGQTPS